MKNVENLGKWLVIGGALVWVGSMFLGPLKSFKHAGTLAVVGGVVIFIVGWVL